MTPDPNALKAAEALRVALLALNAYEPLAPQYPGMPYDLTAKALRGVLVHLYGEHIGDAIYDAAHDTENVADAITQIVEHGYYGRAGVNMLQLRAAEVAEGGSNDAEISALQDALDAALAYIGGTWSER